MATRYITDLETFSDDFNLGQKRVRNFQVSKMFT